MSLGLQVTNPLFDIPDAVGASHQEFTDSLELLPPDCCSRQHLLRLIELAPTAEARAALIGFLDTRVAYSSLFGTGFINEAAEARFEGPHPINDQLDREKDEEFAQMLDSIDPWLCNRSADLLALIQAAPDSVAQAYFIGVLEARVILAHYAGGSFVDEANGFSNG